MDLRYLACTVRHPLFYDIPWAGVSEGRTDQHGGLEELAGEPPQGWTATTREPWTILAAPSRTPPAGWKIHIAARPDEVERILPLVAEYCYATNTSFKFLATVDLVQATQAKYAEMTAAGKVIVIYPVDIEATRRAVEHLRAVLESFRGPRIQGDIPVVGAPLGVRFGAYLHSWMRDEHGRLVAALHKDGEVVHDDRRSRGVSPDEPVFIGELRVEAARSDAEHVLPISEARLLHRSNAGGVYRARWREGTEVVIKEARHHTGYDAKGVEATTRLAHEHAVLERLSATGHAPRPLELLTVGPSDFLIMEFVEGLTCQQIAARSHPLSQPGSGAAELDDYFTLCDQIARAGRQALSSLHLHGVTHGDITPANAVWHEGRIVLLDLESASLDGERVAEGIGTQGFQVMPPGTPEADLASWQVVSEFLVRPEIQLAPTSERMRTQVHADTRPPAPGALASSFAPEDLADQLWQGIVWSSEQLGVQGPRLFPGDIVSVLDPAGAAGILHGASGVLLAALATGQSFPSEWLDWLERAHSSTPREADGLGDGRAGAALTLGLHGRPQAARTAWAAQPEPAPVPWWRQGSAGHLLAAAELWTLTDDVLWRDRAAQAWRQTQLHLASLVNPPSWVPGLLDGWTGVSLALLRVAELVTDRPSWGATADELRVLARDALLRDVARLVPHGHGLALQSGGIGWPYLGNGTASLAWATRVLEAEGLSVDAVDLDRCRATLAVPVTLGVSLMKGRSGLVGALDVLSPASVEVGRQQQRIGWHLVSPDEIGEPGRPGPTRAFGESLPAELVPPTGVLLCPGELGLRYSADLATGAAGVVTALTPNPARSVASALRLPRPR